MKTGIYIIVLFGKKESFSDKLRIRIVYNKLHFSCCSLQLKGKQL